MGSLTEKLHIQPDVADNVAKLILVYLLLGSYGLLFAGSHAVRAVASIRQLKALPNL
jgi:hypothetical protein